MRPDEDPPTRIYPNGTQEWYRDGELHRDGDLPAVIHPDGSQEWYRNGIHYRYAYPHHTEDRASKIRAQAKAMIAEHNQEQITQSDTGFTLID